MANPYFNAAYYLATNLDVLAAGYTVETAEQHYLQHGAVEALSGANTARKPAPWFDIQFYLTSYPDLLAGGITAQTAFEHFTTHGQFEQRSPANGLTVTDAKLQAYADANEDLREAFGITDTANLTDAQKDALTSHFYQYGYTEDRDGAPFDSDVNPGGDFTFTTAIDNLKGSTGDDVFIGDNSGASATVTAGDQVDGGGGRDTIDYYGAAANVVLPQIKNIEVLNLHNPAVTTGLNTSSVVGLEEVNIVNQAVGAANVTGITLAATQVFGLNKVTQTAANSVTVSFGNTATAASLALSNGSNVGTVNLDGTAIKTLNVDSSGSAANTVKGLASTGAESTLNVTGDQKLTITDALNATVKTIDSSAQTAGGVVFTAGNVDIKFTGGAGDDSITFAANQLSSKDIVDGGAGNDTVVINSAVTGDALKAVNAFTNVENLGVGTTGLTLDVDTITSVSQFSILNAGTTKFANASASDKFTVNMSDAGATTEVEVGAKVGELSANVTLNNTSSGAAATLTTLDIDGATTLNLVSSGKATGNANVITTLEVVDNSNIVISGNQDLTITNAVAATTTGHKIDASALTGKLSVIGSTQADIITGGSGADTINGGAGNDILTGNGGADKFVVTNVTAGGRDSITDFVAGTDKVYTSGNAAHTTAVNAVVEKGELSSTTYADIDAAIASFAAAGTNASVAGNAYVFTYGSDTYLLVDNANAGYLAGDDAVIKITGLEGTLTAADIIYAA